MTFNIFVKNFFHLISFFLLYLTIFSQQVSFFEGLKNPLTISIIPYVIFTIQFFIFFLNYKSNILYLKNNKIILIIIVLFFFQLIGFFNSFINNKSIFNYTNIQATYYLFCKGAFIFLILNNKDNYKQILKINIIQIAILLTVILIFILNSRNISYGAIEIIIKATLINFEKIYYANSNGLGRISIILSLFFLLISVYRNKINYFLLLISGIFGGVCLSYEGKFNITMLILLLTYIIYNSRIKKKKNLLLYFFFISITFYFSNYNFNKYQIKFTNINMLDNKSVLNNLNTLEYNSLRILNIKNFEEELIGLTKSHHNYINIKNVIENSLVKKFNNLLTGRINKYFFFVLYNQNFLIGAGPMADRAIANLNNYHVNNDSASAIIYTYLTSGLIGLLIIFFIYFYLLKIFFNKKKEPLFIIFIKSLIILTLFRGLIENSFTIWGIDFIVMFLSVITYKNYCNNINNNNSLGK